MFQLTKEETHKLVTNYDRFEPLKHSSSFPLAFTEQGVAFVHLRRLLADNKALAQRLDELERKYDAQFKVVFDTLRKLIAPPEPPRRPIGFHVREKVAAYTTRGRAR